MTTIINIITGIAIAIAGLFGYTAPIPQPLPTPPPIQSFQPVPVVVSPVLPPPKKLSGLVAVEPDAIVASDAIVIDEKEYSDSEYVNLKTLLVDKIRRNEPLKKEKDNNEEKQWNESVNRELQKCRGRIGAVDGDVVAALNNLLINGCPK